MALDDERHLGPPPDLFSYAGQQAEEGDNFSACA